METLLLVQTILLAGSRVAAAVGGGEAPGSSDLQELLSSFKAALLPEFVEEQEKRAEKIRKIVEEEAKVGSFQVQAMTYEKRKKKGLN